jgi:hypothetical protein
MHNTETNIYSNSCNTNASHFPAALDLIRWARAHFKVASENWPYPTIHRLGDPRDGYYAEVWQDGMDWQNSYWIIESIKHDNPKIQPIIIFEDHRDEEKFNAYDFANLLRAIMQKRRWKLWFDSDEKLKDFLGMILFGLLYMLVAVKNTTL